jgi:hypothetical protein
VGAGVLGVCEGDSAGYALSEGCGMEEILGLDTVIHSSLRCSVLLFLMCRVTVGRSGAPAQHLATH